MKSSVTQPVQQKQRYSHIHLRSDRKSGPNFLISQPGDVDVEYRLRQADLLCMSEGIYLKVTKELKHEILERLAESMYCYTAYPTAAQFESVAAALINKHPCLQERGSTIRCCGWKIV